VEIGDFGRYNHAIPTQPATAEILNGGGKTHKTRETHSVGSSSHAKSHGLVYELYELYEFF
jgi:hypothetical protein